MPLDSTSLTTISNIRYTPIEILIFSAAGFNQFGLYHDDALHENAEVKEALSRLPQVPFSATVRLKDPI